MPGSTTVSRTGNQDTDGLLSGVRWDTTGLTYSFPSSASLYEATYGGNNEPSSPFRPLNAQQQATVHAAYRMLSEITNLSFTLVTESTSTHADLRFGMTDNTLYNTAWAYSPSSSARGGDSWYRIAGGQYDNPTLGSYAYHTFLHEIGHSLGLKHGHETYNFGAMTAAHDSMEYSVMTYRSYAGGGTSNYTNEFWGYAQSFMMHDIAALQHMYGADFTTNSGNTTYSFSPTTGEMFVNGFGQGAPGANRIFRTVWDGGGNDTYDFSLYGNGLQIDLTPGGYSVTSSTQLANLGNGHFARGNLFNALQYNGDARSLIENAFGGSGNDSINGNAANNYLFGGSGSDTLSGGLGADTLNGGTGNDVMTGGAGRDVLYGGSGIGHDRFDYNSVSDSRWGAANRDVIMDFGDSLFSNDIIDLSTIDARPSTLFFNDAFTFIGSAPFTAAGQVRVANSGLDKIVEVNTVRGFLIDLPEMQIVLAGRAGYSIDASDFWL